MDALRSSFQGRVPVEWHTQAEKYERMAERFSHRPELSKSFRQLAAEARDRANSSIR
jgi:hypothetical protein